MAKRLKLVRGDDLITLSKKPIAEGGDLFNNLGLEAQVFRLNEGELGKVHRLPSDSRYEHNKLEQQAARERIETHQRKLEAFPRNLPEGAVGPIDLLHEKLGFVKGIFKNPQVRGFVMPWVKDAHKIDHYFSPKSRDDDVSEYHVVECLLDLHRILSGCHEKGFVIGDLNEGNVLVRGNRAFLIDMDAGSFGEWTCDTYKEEFVDPLLCEASVQNTMVMRPGAHHSPESDWYAFTMLAVACLTYVHMYDGGYEGDTCFDSLRPLHRIHVLRPDVIYPNYAGSKDIQSLPEEFVNYLLKVVEEDWRGIFPRSLLENLIYCSSGKSKAKLSFELPWPIPQTCKIDKDVGLAEIKAVRGNFTTCAIQNGGLRYVVYTSETYRRENGFTVVEGETRDEYEAVGQFRGYYIHGEQTLLTNDNNVTITSARGRETFQVDDFGGIPSLATNERWIACVVDKDIRVAFGDHTFKTIDTSPYDYSMVYLAHDHLLVYGRTKENTNLALYNLSESSPKRRELSFDFDTDRPSSLDWYPGTNEQFWLVTTHVEQEQSNIRIHVVNATGKVVKHGSVGTTIPPQLMTVQGDRLYLLDPKRNALLGARFSFGSIRQETICEIPFSGDVVRLLPHPHTDGMVVVQNNSQIWEIVKGVKYDGLRQVA